MKRQVLSLERVMMSAWACVCGTAVGPDTRVRSFLIGM